MNALDAARETLADIEARTIGADELQTIASVLGVKVLAAEWARVERWVRARQRCFEHALDAMRCEHSDLASIESAATELQNAWLAPFEARDKRARTQAEAFGLTLNMSSGDPFESLIDALRGGQAPLNVAREAAESFARAFRAMESPKPVVLGHAMAQVASSARRTVCSGLAPHLVADVSHVLGAALVVYRPLPGRGLRVSSQLTLPLVFGARQDVSLSAPLGNAWRAVIQLGAAAAQTRGGWGEIALGDLARAIYPGIVRLRRTHLAATAGQLLRLDELRIFANGARANLFHFGQLPLVEHVSRDFMIRFALSHEAQSIGGTTRMATRAMMQLSNTAVGDRAAWLYSLLCGHWSAARSCKLEATMRELVEWADAARGASFDAERQMTSDALDMLQSLHLVSARLKGQARNTRWELAAPDDWRCRASSENTPQTLRKWREADQIPGG